MNPQSIIVSGASGWLGREILKSTARKTAFGLFRDKAVADAYGSTFAGDLSDPLRISRLVEQYNNLDLQADCFIHCAGLAHQPNETQEIKRAMWQTNDIGTANALEFCKQVGINKFVYISTIAGYDWTSIEQATEDSKLVPITEYAKSKISAENRVLASPIDSRIIRLATVFGQGDIANFSRLSTLLRKRRFPIPGEGIARKSVIPIDTAASLIAKFATMDKVPYQTINLALPEAPTLNEICDCFSRVCKFPRAPRVPLPAIKALAMIGDCFSTIWEMPFSTNVLNKLTTSTCVNTDRIQTIFPKELLESFEVSLERHANYYQSLHS
ncbi:NAD(P)-dependent oxidoreductase [Pelagicoccus sp. SDUM812003]|uniref:NAD-dependent epimerase/dehydratase family protein n=1 Tax=Pelagicoccus sp. SDUM812003 TaxID=3041267 RepID=UPI00280F624D|nr:NAD(P)-dependent oxidoreductase [Pelagicoccus sp. SDUM812003]MDQ8205628.1 NAD(P)-dependent oxidoreductase [Pelagicoccus sp. SDUM812003]